MKKILSLLTLLTFLPIISKNRSLEYEKKGLILIIPLCNQESSQKTTEHIKCLKENLKNDYIKKIHTVYNTSHDSDLNEIHNFLKENNLTITYCDETPNFQSLFDFANQTYPQEKVIISNPDITFNESLGKLASYNLKNMFIALSRWDITTRHNLNSWTNTKKQPATIGQDTWIFQTPVSLNNVDTEICSLYCSPKLYQRVKATDMRLINPCLSIITNHTAEPEIRNWDETGRSKQTFTIEADCLPISKK